MITEKEAKAKIKGWMDFLVECKKVFDAEGKSLEVQRKVQKMKFEGYLVEVESPELDNTGGDWIRLNYADCYLFLNDDGTEEYQYDPYALYGEEVIIAYDYKSFIEELDKLKNTRKFFEDSEEQ